MFPSSSTRIKGTEKSYLNRAKTLIQKYQKHRNLDFDDLDDFYAWTDDCALKLRKATIRHYRASISFYFEKNSIDFDRSRLYSLRTNNPLEGKRTSSLKDKKINIDELIKLVNALRQSRSKYSELAISLILLGEIFGLRPVEWCGVKLKSNLEDENKAVLIVNNAKHTNGRSFGAQRYIEFDWTLLDEPINTALACVFSELVPKQKSEAIRLLRSVRNLINRKNREIGVKPFETRITLYSGRHQFTSNLKSNGFSKDEIAKLMGHASIETHSRYYGKKSAGRFGVDVKLDESHAVEMNAEEYEEVEVFKHAN